MATTRINVITYNTPGTYTYTPSVGMRNIMVEVLGAGGASGPALASSNAISGEVGAGAGGYAKSIYSRGFVDIETIEVVVGAGGITPVDISRGIRGTSGGHSSFGPFIRCAGGYGSMTLNSGGTGWPPLYDEKVAGYVGAGGIASGGNVFNVDGQPGGTVISFPADGTNINSSGVSGSGGSSYYGNGGYATGRVWPPVTPSFPGNPGVGFGSGASGAVSGPGFVNISGANGAPGLVIITEYIQ